MDDGIRLLQTLADLPSGSGDAAGLDRCGDVVRPRLQALGFDVDRRPLGDVPHLVARRPGPAGAPRALLVIHLDTVLADPSWRFSTEGDHGHGPGVADPIGGVVVLIRSLERLAGDGALDRAGWTVVLNGDEELGSPASAPLLEELAAEADAAFVFESARADGSLVRARSGSAVCHVEVEGRAAHAGVNPEDGASAILALAHVVIAVEAAKAPERGLFVNVGTCRGGLKRNQVPDRASAEVDVRFSDPEDGPRALAALSEACGRAADRVPGTRARVERVRGRPAWPGGEGTDRLVRCWLSAADDLGLERPGAVATGGGSDANILAAAGVPCLDGLGAVGGGYHTREEWVVLPTVEERCRLAARGLLRWIDAGE